MIPEEQNPRVHHMTVKAAGTALAQRQISQENYRAVLRGELSLAEAKSLGRDRGPNTPEDHSGPGEATEAPRKGRTPRPCGCGCGGTTKGGVYLPGHDAKLRSELMAQIRKGDVLLRSERITPEQRAFAVRHGLISEEALPEEERDG
jgi:hypothetical protein